MQTELFPTESYLGKYVEYKSKPYLVVDVRDNKVLLLNPEINSKIQVLISNIKLLNYKPANLVNYRGNDYLVTAKELIISLVSHKVMKWDASNGGRIAILALV